MAYEVRRARQGVVEFRDGDPVYAQEVWEGKGLIDREASSQQVIILSILANPDFPPEGSERYGLPMRGMRVSEKAGAGDQRRIYVTWGLRSLGGGVSAATRDTRTVDIGNSDLIQPYIVGFTDGGVAYSRVKTRTLQRGNFDIYQGQIVDSGFTPEGIRLTSASNRNKLYTIGGQAALHVGVETNRLRSNQLWVWTIFRQNGFVKGVDANAIEPGQKPVEFLNPLDTYGALTTTGTPRRPVTDDFEPGEVLPWQV